MGTNILSFLEVQGSYYLGQYNQMVVDDLMLIDWRKAKAEGNWGQNEKVKLFL